MNLYSIDFQHYSPKDSECGVKCLVLAETDEQVYDWLCTSPNIREGDRIFTDWKNPLETVDSVFDDDAEEAAQEWESIEEDDDFYEESAQSFKERMISIRGEMYDEEKELNNLFYGVTLYGWTLLLEDTKFDYSELISINFVIQL